MCNTRTVRLVFIELHSTNTKAIKYIVFELFVLYLNSYAFDLKNSIVKNYFFSE
jgi:hypothetical protein